MSRNQENILESFIKVEPEEFETVSSDDVLKFKANIFSDPSVLLERLNFKITTSLFPIEAQSKNEIDFTEIAQISARKRSEKTKRYDLHSCSICHKVFVNRQSFNNHFETFQSRSTRMLCDLCPKIYFAKQSIIRHMKTVHSKKMFACNDCDYKTANKTYFQKHKMIHTAKGKWPICKKEDSVLKFHMLTHKPKAPCSICQKLVSKNNLRAHMNLNHGKVKCTDCDEVLASKEDLRRHKLIRHYNGKIFICHCGSVFSRKHGLRKHQKSVHNSEKPTCKVCQQQFSNGCSFKVHWKNKHSKTHGKLCMGTKNRVLNTSGPFICDKCGSKHRSRKTFHSHNNRHHQKITLFCDLCPRYFPQKELLVRHIKRDHLKIRPFQCKDCEYGSFFKYDLKTHMKQHDPKTQCRICLKFVKNIDPHLDGHIKVKCLICSKILSKSSIYKHLRRHYNVDNQKNI